MPNREDVSVATYTRLQTARALARDAVPQPDAWNVIAHLEDEQITLINSYWRRDETILPNDVLAHVRALDEAIAIVRRSAWGEDK